MSCYVRSVHDFVHVLAFLCIILPVHTWVAPRQPYLPHLDASRSIDHVETRCLVTYFLNPCWTPPSSPGPCASPDSAPLSTVLASRTRAPPFSLRLFSPYRLRPAGSMRPSFAVGTNVGKKKVVVRGSGSGCSHKAYPALAVVRDGRATSRRRPGGCPGGGCGVLVFWD